MGWLALYGVLEVSERAMDHDEQAVEAYALLREHCAQRVDHATRACASRTNTVRNSGSGESTDGRGRENCYKRTFGKDGGVGVRRVELGGDAPGELRT